MIRKEVTTVFTQFCPGRSLNSERNSFSIVLAHDFSETSRGLNSSNRTTAFLDQHQRNGALPAAHVFFFLVGCGRFGGTEELRGVQEHIAAGVVGRGEGE